MRVFISADMEGATGVVSVCQTDSSRPEYAFGCGMQLHDVNAVVRGLCEAGVEEILVNDSHDRMINLNIEGLDPRVRLLTGSPKIMSMLEGFEGADAAFFVGYHAMAGTGTAVLDHTISGRRVYSIRLNGFDVGEIGLNAAVCAQKRIPVALVTGDRAACLEAEALLGGGLVTACIKEAHGRCAADCLTPEASAPLLAQAAKDAVKRVREGTAPRMAIGDGSFTLDVSFHTTAQCDRAAMVPLAERVAGRTLRIRGRDMVEMRRWAGVLIGLGSD